MTRNASLLAAAAALALAALAGAPAARAADPAPRVVSELPAWLAPGGRLAVDGVAAPRERIVLLVGNRVVARGRSGPRGRFHLEGRAPANGRYAIVVRAGTGDVRVGRLHVRPLVLAGVGDVTFGARVGEAIRAYGPRYPWLSVAPVLRRADLAVANLEGAVSTRGAPVPGKAYHFRGRPSALAAAARFAGIDAVALANNHTLDFGRTAFLDTLRYARRFGVATAGGGVDLRAARRPALLEAGGLRIAFLAFSDVRPPGFDARPGRAGTAPAFPDLVAGDVRAARRRADAVVVYFHWGVERAFRPSGRQRALARVALDAGATVVLGAHPHVLQPVERRSRRLVAWSLGNFVFGANSPATDRTGILSVRLARSGVVGYSFRRARIGGPLRVQPRLVR